MRLSQKSDYALRAMLMLAQSHRKGECLSMTNIAAQEGVPKKFLEQILLTLKHRGLVLSRMGSKGGYALAFRPEEITFGQVMRAIEGSLAPLACVEDPGVCPGHEHCGFRGVMMRLDAAINGVVDSTTLADAIESRP